MHAFSSPSGAAKNPLIVNESCMTLLTLDKSLPAMGKDSGGPPEPPSTMPREFLVARAARFPRGEV